MPLFAEEGIWVDAGALMSYATNEIDTYRLFATYVDKILKGSPPTCRSSSLPNSSLWLISRRPRRLAWRFRR